MPHIRYPYLLKRTDKAFWLADMPMHMFFAVATTAGMVATFAAADFDFVQQRKLEQLQVPSIYSPTYAPEVCRTIAFDRCWAIILLTLRVEVESKAL